MQFRRDFQKTTRSELLKSAYTLYELMRLIPGGFFLFLLLTKAIYGQDTLHVHENIYVPPGETFSIGAGTVVFFHGYHHLQVEGGLRVTGEPDSPVIFTSADTTGISDTYISAGGWNGIRILPSPEDETALPVVIRHAVFEFSKASVQDFSHGGALSVVGHRDVLISHCVFRDNYAFRYGGAVYLENNNAIISHSQFLNNKATNHETNVWAYGGGIYTTGSRCEISWCIFENNHAWGMGGAINFEESSPTAFNNIIRNNNAPLGGGIGIIRNHSNTILSNNLIADNSAEFFGGGIAFVDAFINLANSNIINNYAGAGGGLYFNEISSPNIYNCIIRDNWSYQGVLSQVWIWDALSGPAFFNNNIQGGFDAFYSPGEEDFQGQYANNIDDDPLFADPMEGDFTLLEGSPSIDTGYEFSALLDIHTVDLSGNERFSGINIDMGPIEFQDPYDYFVVSISTEGQGYTLPAPGQYTFKEGSVFVVEAHADSSWYFDHWECTHDTFFTPELELTVDNDLELKAVFALSSGVISDSRFDISIYPNPASDHIRINLPDAMYDAVLPVEISDAGGNIIHKVYYEDPDQLSEILVDVSHFGNGIYFIRFIAGYSVYTARFVKL